MEEEAQKKVLLISGGNEGIGFAVTQAWLKKGNYAAALDIHTENLKRLQETYPEALLVLDCDMRDVSAVQSAINQTAARFGQIDYAIHNACLCIFKSFETHTDQNYDDVMDVNFKGARNLTRAVLPIMASQAGGRVYFTSSGVGITGFSNLSAYCASKGAIESFAKCMNLEFKESGVTFHILQPPLTRTKSSSPLPVPPEFMAQAEKVGEGFVRRLDKNKFVIAPSFSDALSVRMSYLFSVSMGRLLTRMTEHAKS